MDAKTFLMGSGSAAFSFYNPGDRIVGQIVADPTMQQQKVFGTNDLAFWPSGDPKMQMLVQVQTSFRNYEGMANPDRAQPDDGTRTIYVKGKHFERATREAVRQAGAKFLDVGGWIEVTFDGLDMTSKAGSKPKLYSVRYQKPPTQAAPQHLSQPQQGYRGAAQGYPPQAYQDQGYPAQQPPRPPQAAQPNWQQAGWTSQAQATVPSHHGQPDSMPAWAQASAPPAPSSAPPAPALSTLDLIRQSQTDGSGSGQVEPTF